VRAGQKDKAQQMFQQAAALPVAVKEKVATRGDLKELH
jgi:hypothetical protein